MLKKISLCLLILSSCILLSGCVKYDTHIEITPSGDANTTIRVLGNNDEIYLPSNQIEKCKTILWDYLKEKGFSLTETSDISYPNGIKANIYVKNILKNDIPRLTNGMDSISKDGKYISGKNFLFINYFLIDWDINVHEAKEGEELTPEYLESAVKIENGQNNNFLYIKLPYKALKHNATYLQEKNQYIWKLKTGHNSVHIEFWLFNYVGIIVTIITIILFSFLFLKRKVIFHSNTKMKLKKFRIIIKRKLKRQKLLYWLAIVCIVVFISCIFFFKDKIALTFTNSAIQLIEKQNYSDAKSRIYFATLMDSKSAENNLKKLLDKSLECAINQDYKTSLEVIKIVKSLDEGLCKSYSSKFSKIAAEKGYDGLHSVAIEIFSIAIELDNKSSKAYLGRGILYSSLKENNKAFQDFNMAINIDNTSSFAYAMRSVLFLEQEETTKAEIDADRAIELNNDDKALAFAYLCKAKINKEKMNHHDAMNCAKKSIKLFKKLRHKYGYESAVNEFISAQKIYEEVLEEQIYYLGYTDEFLEYNPYTDDPY